MSLFYRRDLIIGESFSIKIVLPAFVFVKSANSNLNITNHVGAGWIVLDVLCGLVPVIIDAATGAWCDLDQKNIKAVLEKVIQPD